LRRLPLPSSEVSNEPGELQDTPVSGAAIVPRIALVGQENAAGHRTFRSWVLRPSRKQRGWPAVSCDATVVTKSPSYCHAMVICPANTSRVGFPPADDTNGSLGTIGMAGEPTPADHRRDGAARSAIRDATGLCLSTTTRTRGVARSQALHAHQNRDQGSDEWL
jgi:hypothetical protein